MAVKRKVKSTKARKKTWFPVVSPKILGEQVIGETCAYEKEDVVGTKMTLNLSRIANDMKRQNITLKFVVEKVHENKAHTKVIGYQMIPSSIRRFIRRGRDRIDESFKVKCKDGVLICVKPLLLTRNTTVRSVQTALRHEVKKLIADAGKHLVFDEFMTEVISHKMQRLLRDRLKKIYPLKSCEIRSVSLAKERGAKIVEAPEEEESAPDVDSEEIVAEVEAAAEEESPVSESESEQPEAVA